MTDTLSLAEARRIALAAQGFSDARPRGAPHLRHLHRVLERTALFQIDSVNVLTRAHYLPLYARLGAYPRGLLEQAAWGPRKTLFEYWAHEASLLPLELHPWLRWRMARAERGEGIWGRLKPFAGERRPKAETILQRISAEGPLAASDLEGAKGQGGWWGWSDAKSALEWLFWTGRITTATRRASFERVYDLSERVLPGAILDRPTPTEPDAHRHLLLIAARSLGVATAGDLRDYFRLSPDDAKPRIGELVEAGEITKTILTVALPAMLTNVATALFGLADVWVIGWLGDVTAQGGVEIGAKLITALLILFNFLRSSTVALTARAAGRNDAQAQAAVLVRAVTLALLIGALLLLAMPIVIPAGLSLYGAAGEVAIKAKNYAQIRACSALPWLFNAVLTGWLIGQRKVRSVLAVEVGSNLLHVALDVALVLHFRLGVSGVATATLCSESAKFLALATIVASAAPARFTWPSLRQSSTWNLDEIASVLRLNRDLFGRTLLLMAAVLLLTRAGARQGPVILATNAILYQFFILSALLLDGFESAAQVLCGEAAGAGTQAEFTRVVRLTLAWASVVALIIAGLYRVFGSPLAGSFSTAPAVIGMAQRYIGWAVLMPLVGFASYVFDGVFVGAGWTRAMLLTMAAALAAFLVLLVVLQRFGDGGLWLAFCLFLFVRGAGQAVMLPGLARRSFELPPAGDARIGS